MLPDAGRRRPTSAGIAGVGRRQRQPMQADAGRRMYIYIYVSYLYIYIYKHIFPLYIPYILSLYLTFACMTAAAWMLFALQARRSLRSILRKALAMKASAGCPENSPCTARPCTARRRTAAPRMGDRGSMICNRMHNKRSHETAK